MLNYMQTLKPQNLLHKRQELTKTLRQLTIINTEKCNYSQSSQRAFRSLWQLSLCGHDRKDLTDANKDACTLAAKSETQQRSEELKYISVQRQRNKMIILRVGGLSSAY